MPRKTLPMPKISEVLRIKAEDLSNRDIAASVGASKSAVYGYLARPEEVFPALPASVAPGTLNCMAIRAE